MTGAEFQEALVSILGSMPEDDLVDIFNSVCDDYGDPHQKAYFMEEFDDVTTYDFGMTPSSIISQLDASFSLDDAYFAITDDGIVSFNKLSGDDIQTIVDAITDLGSSYGNDDIQAIIDEVDAS